jgi:heme-degrading monooxygenase HmoA
MARVAGRAPRASSAGCIIDGPAMSDDLLGEFYQAWNARDTDWLTRLFADEGTLTDPLCRRELAGGALHAHLDMLTAALPELRFALQSSYRDGSRAVATWSLNAICRGALDTELAPPEEQWEDAQGVHTQFAEVPFVLDGVDVFELADGEHLQCVRRYFDRRALADQLGLQTIVEPVQVGTMTFGYSLRDSGSTAKPGLLGVTWIQARNEEEKAKIRLYARRIVKGFRNVPGFIGIVTGFAGLHGFTLTAWENEDALRAGVHGRDHVEAMRGFHAGTSVGVFTSVWQPLRLNRIWQRCAQCGTPNDAHASERVCVKCGAALPEAPSYV